MTSQTAITLHDLIRSRIPEPLSRSPRTPDEIASVATIIAEQFQPERIVLFGSYAHGTVTKDSDIDLMVIMNTCRKPIEQAVEIRQAVGRYHRFAMDIIVRKPEQIALGLAERNFFILDVMTDGVTLYEDQEKAMERASRNGGELTDKDHQRQAAGLKEATKEWVENAESDYRGAAYLLTAPNPELGLICYHSQQCVEKYLKALLQQYDLAFPRTHDLRELSNLADSILPGLDEHAADLQWLTGYAVNTRYPGAIANQMQTSRALSIATALREQIRAALGMDRET